MSHPIIKATLLLSILINAGISLAQTQKHAPAANNLLALNQATFPIYAHEQAHFRSKLMHTVPVIVARFSSDGGVFTLYRPGHKPLKAPPAPLLYQLAKSVGHAVMITENMTRPYIATSITDKSWRPILQGFKVKIATATSTLEDLDTSEPNKQIFQAVLNSISEFLSTCLQQDQIKKTDLDHFVLKIRPFLPMIIKIGAQTQIKHQMAVLERWKRLLAKDWQIMHAITNTIYVTRQNNIIFSMLAEFMGKNTINHRLFLFETISFTTTNDELLDLWSRIMFDRQLSNSLFSNEYLMDSELMNNGGRQIIIDEAHKYHLPNLLPPEAPFNSTEWPWRHNPHSGSGPTNLEQVAQDGASYERI